MIQNSTESRDVGDKPPDAPLCLLEEEIVMMEIGSICIGTGCKLHAQHALVHKRLLLVDDALHAIVPASIVRICGRKAEVHFLTLIVVSNRIAEVIA